jgi:hypothetical protein
MLLPAIGRNNQSDLLQLKNNRFLKMKHSMKFAFVTALLAMALVYSCAAQNSDAPDGSITPGALPSNIAPNSPLAQVIQLAQSGEDESVILSYINSASSAFNLTADQIIYLKDLGLPDDAVTAMIQRDQQLSAVANATPTTITETTAQTETPAQPAYVTENYFYDTLSPYGGWVNVEGCGLCWRPTVVVYDSSWQPYCDHGRWIYTDSGWYWASDYSWGATAFHYGRWFHHPRFGWCWWPDTAWAPSWVTWRSANDYCGWAPLPPHAIYRPGTGIVYNGVVVNAGFDFDIAVNFFIFVPIRNFCDSHPRHYRVAPAQVAQIYSHTTIINNFNFENHAIVNNGIPPQHITAVSGVQIHPVRIEPTTALPGHRTLAERFGQNGQTLIVNRPQFAENAAASLNRGTRPRPEIPNRNNFSQPIINQNPQLGHSWSAPQNPQAGHSETPQVNAHESQKHDNLFASTPNYNSNHNNNQNTWSVPPKIQQSQHQTPRTVTPVEHDEPLPAHSPPAPSKAQKSDKENWPQGGTSH